MNLGEAPGPAYLRTSSLGVVGLAAQGIIRAEQRIQRVMLPMLWSPSHT